ncbi:MAG: ABC transporter substrate-binding protein [Thermodesulfobacteriota bacterium]
MKRKRLLIFLTIFIVTAGLTFLAFTRAQAAKQGGVLKIALGMNPDLMDPPNSYASSDMMIGCHIFERLIDLQYDLQTGRTTPKPALAEKWETSADGKVWTFYLRKGVFFHDGTPFNAEAVKFNIERTIHPEKKTRYGGDLRAMVEKVEKVDDSTVKIFCRLPGGVFLHLMGEPFLWMISPKSVADYGDKVGRNPVGTGPFKFAKWTPNESVELAVNDKYWAGRANLDGIVFRFVPDGAARMNMLQTGEVDVIYNVPAPDHERLRKTGRIEVLSWPTAEILRLMLNCQIAPGNDPKVRQAVKLAIDRPGIIKAVLMNNAQPAKSTIAPFSWGYYPAAEVVHDPQKAKKLLEEAGWVDTDKDGLREKDGKKLTLTIRAPQPGRYPMDQECLLAIQENLRQVGIDCKINFMEFAAFMGSLFVPLEKSNGDAIFVSWSSRTHAWFATYKILHSKFWVPNGINIAYYKNGDMDKLLDAAVMEADEAKAAEIYKKVQIMVEEEVPQISLWILNSTIAKKKNVQGLVTVPIPVSDMFHARGAWIE